MGKKEILMTEKEFQQYIKNLLNEYMKGDKKAQKQIKHLIKKGIIFKDNNSWVIYDL